MAWLNAPNLAGVLVMVLIAAERMADTNGPKTPVGTFCTIKNGSTLSAYCAGCNDIAN